MCVHVFRACQMPNSTLVWVDPVGAHFFAYADSSLATDAGKLTGEGVCQVNAALAAVPGAPSLESAKPCSEPLL